MPEPETPVSTVLDEPVTCEYWKQAARDAAARWPERLTYMEQAFNHALNWAYALKELIVDKPEVVWDKIVKHYRYQIHRLTAEKKNLIERNAILRDRPDLDIPAMRLRLARLDFIKRHDQLEKFEAATRPTMELVERVLLEIYSNGDKLPVETLAAMAGEALEEVRIALAAFRNLDGTPAADR